MTATRAAITDGRGRFTLSSIETGPPGPGEVRVEMRAAGLCGQDYRDLQNGAPLVLGQEGAGFVEECGDGVTHVQPGDRVLVHPLIACGSCWQCGQEAPYLCESVPEVRPDGVRWRGKPIRRARGLGTLSPLALVREEALTLLPQDLSFESACSIGGGVLTGFGAAMNAVEIRAADSVVVLGCGPVGLNVLQGARVSGSGRIIAVDVRPSALDEASVFGATDTMLASPGDPDLHDVRQRIMELTFHRGADFCFECTGEPEMAFAPMRLLRPGGTAVRLSDCGGSHFTDLSLLDGGRTLLCPPHGLSRPGRDFDRIFSLYARRELLLDELVTRTWPLEELTDAMDDMLHGRISKGVILF